jgi:hypothetical protein
MPTIDYSTWLTKDQTAAKLGVSTKQVERFAQARKLQQVRWKRPTGGQPIAVYAPADVDRLAHKLAPSRPFVAPDDTALEPAASGRGLRRQEAPPAAGALALQGFVHLMQQLAEQSEQSQTVYLTVKQAARFTGLSQAYLRRACQVGEVQAKKDGAWKIRRTALAAL